MLYSASKDNAYFIIDISAEILISQVINVNMATYKKRSTNRSNSEKSKSGSQSTTKEVFETLDVTASRTEQWVSKNQNIILIAIGVVAVVVIGYLANQRFILEPKEREVAGEIGQAQHYFNLALNSTNSSDSLYRLALEGGEGKYGFLDIIENYKGTKGARLARYSAGISYLRLGEFNNAIRQLELFKSDDLILNAMSKGAIADAFAGIGQPEEAYEYYVKAAETNKNNFTTPKFLYKAGLLAMDLNRDDKALEFFTQIQDDYPDAHEAELIEILVTKIETKLQ